MRFWDSSAIVPLLCRQAATDKLLELHAQTGVMLVWWGTRLEIVSAISRLVREKQIADAQPIFDQLDGLENSWQTVLPCTEILETAERLLRTHPLRAADAMQLAAAGIAADHRPKTMEFVCRDLRLREAAQREGFRVI